MPSPSGRRLDDGHATFITFSLNDDIGLWEKGVKPPGVEGGESVDTTTMRNLIYRTKNPRKLKELTNMSGTCAYDEFVLAAVVDMVNKLQTITVTFPNGRTWSFPGYLKTFDPQELSEGAQPVASYTIVPTMQNAAGVETGPTVGTTTSTTTTTA